MRKWNRFFSRAAILCIVGTAVSIGGCSKKDKATNPTPMPRELDSPLLGQNDTYAHAFTTAGSFAYFCTRHSGMTGSVTVEAGAAMDVDVDISSFTFAPNPAVVGVGGTVTWRNLDSSAHTVTSVSVNPY